MRTPRKGRQSLWKKLVLALGSIAVTLGLAELAVRIWVQPPRPGEGFIYTTNGDKVPLSEIVHFLGRSSDRSRLSKIGPRSYLLENIKFKVGYSNAKWAYFDADGSVPVQHNSRGFRDAEFSLKKPPGEFRILALGDSFTYGQGVRVEDSWPQQLESRLEARRQGPVEVMNAGFCFGHTPHYYAQWLSSDGLHFEPDLVIVGFCLNDMGDVPMVAYDQAELAPDELWCRSSALVTTLQRTLAQRRLSSTKQDFSERVLRNDTVWVESQAGLVHMRDELSARGIGFFVAIFPMLSQLDEAYSYGRLHAMVQDFCRSNEIRCVDLLPKFLGRNEFELWVHSSDQHPNDVGHRLMAEGILEFLDEQKLLP